MNKRKILGILLFVAAALLLLYPAGSNLWNTYRSWQLRQAYTQTLNESNADDFSALWEAAEAYNASLTAASETEEGRITGDAFAQTEDETEDGLYESLLNIAGDGVMGYITIPKIDLNLPIYHGTSQEVLEQGVGHLEGTALPIGSVGGHSILAGHRGLPAAALFTDLDQMVEGDCFYLHILDRVLAYRITGIEVTEPEDTASLEAVPGKDLVTLVTCTPYGINSHRLLLHAERTEQTSEEALAAEVQEQSGAKGLTWFQKAAYVIPVTALLLALLILLLMRRRSRRKD